MAQKEKKFFTLGELRRMSSGIRLEGAVLSEMSRRREKTRHIEALAAFNDWKAKGFPISRAFAAGIR